jgi:hypothetical protein
MEFACQSLWRVQAGSNKTGEDMMTASFSCLTFGDDDTPR